MNKIKHFISLTNKMILTTLLVTFSTILHGTTVESASAIYNCDSNAIKDNKKATDLNPNTLYKICPGTRSNKPFGQPKCGDSTPFSFFFSRPTQKKDNQEKIIIEFMGGGACWDAQTCDMQANYLTFPTMLDNFIGYSCSEVSYWAENGGDMDGGGRQRNLDDIDISMLCAKTVGNVDFTTYNSIIVPYCTQDIHIGSNTTSYSDNDDDDDGSSSSSVNHMGAHNMMSTLRWIFKNFPNPSHIVLTGCSAGGAVLPIAYDLLNKHYNYRLIHAGLKSVSISVLADSPVYLTPSYFLQYGISQWNPYTILERLNFDYDAYMYDADFPNYLWDYVLNRGPNSDRWGVLTHTYDPVSMLYYKYMSGYNNQNNRLLLSDANNSPATKTNIVPEKEQVHEFQKDRMLEEDDDNENSWWNQLNTSLITIKQGHKNVDTFLMDSEGHCAIGLYYGLQYEGFENWASNIFQERRVIGRASLPSLFFKLSISLAVVLIYLSGYILQKNAATTNKALASLKQELTTTNDVSMDITNKSQQQCCNIFSSPRLISLLTFITKHPITFGYALSISLYFLLMITTSGFTHPLNNPVLGPSAITLSAYGINNPSLIIYNHQIWRIFTSSLLNSGIITYATVMYGIWNVVRILEENINNTLIFTLVFFSISLGCNLFYAIVASVVVIDGGVVSCGSVALILGLNALSISLRMRFPNVDHPSYPVKVRYTLSFVLIALISPFDSWIMFTYSVVIGVFIAIALFKKISVDCEDDDIISKNITPDEELLYQERRQQHFTPRIKLWVTLCITYGIMLIILISGITKPDIKYQTPFLTGCEMIYSTDIMEDTCCQICIPRTVSSIAIQYELPKRFSGYDFIQGMCEDNGYEEHAVDKTFSYFSYVLDVEVYYPV